MPIDNNISNPKENTKSLLTSLAIHAILLLFAFFFTVTADLTPPDPPLEKDFEVNIDIPEVTQKIKKTPKVKVRESEDMAESSNSTKAEADKGESRPLNPEVQKVEVNDPKPPPAKVEPTPTPPAPTPAPTPKPIPAPPAKAPSTPTTAPKPSTQAPVVTKESDVEVEAPKKEAPPARPAPAPSTPSTSSGGGKPSSTPSTPTSVPKPGAGTVGSPTGTGNKPQSNTDGNGRGKSDSGSGLGDGSGTDVTSGTGNSSDGTGAYDGSGNGIFGRQPVFSNFKAFPFEQSGTVYMRVCINPEGNVTFAEILPATTITNKSTLRKFIKAIRGYKYTRKPNAPDEECGKFSYKVDLSAINKLRG
jgi:outer membrane biosynthesis protein TonB